MLTREILDAFLELRIERLKRELRLLDEVAREVAPERLIRIEPAK
jgi:hypothetical protein